MANDGHRPNNLLIISDQHRADCLGAYGKQQTGLYPHQHLGWSNSCTIPNGLDTFPQLFKQAGYEQMELAEQNGVGRYEDDYHRFLYQRGLVDRNE